VAVVLLPTTASAFTQTAVDATDAPSGPQGRTDLRSISWSVGTATTVVTVAVDESRFGAGALATIGVHVLIDANRDGIADAEVTAARAADGVAIDMALRTLQGVSSTTACQELAGVVSSSATVTSTVASGRETFAFSFQSSGLADGLSSFRWAAVGQSPGETAPTGPWDYLPDSANPDATAANPGDRRCGATKTGLRAVMASTVQDPTSVYTPVTPTRRLDTRTGTGGPATAFGAGETRSVAMTGGTVPADATAAVVNVTVTSPSADGYLTVFPGGVSRPLASSINFRGGETIANLVTVGLGPTGALAIYNDAGTTDVIADIVGFYRAPTGDRYTATQPSRVLDTRTGVGGSTSAWAPGEMREVGVATGGVPADATAVVVNVTVTETTAASYLTVYPAGVPRPLASNVNWTAGTTIPNLVIVGLGTGSHAGKIGVYNDAGTAHVLADVVGWYRPGTSGARFRAVTPTRLLDTRSTTALASQETRGLVVRGPPTAIPSGATAVVMNVTATEPSVGGYLSVFPGGTSRPSSSNLNFRPRETIANLVIVGVGTTGAGLNRASLYNDAGSTHVIADVVGYMI
jgi:hypothetical protein